MKKSIQIQIPEPCHESWDKMTAANQGRFCNACSKVVVDFSMMSDKEILNHISKASSSICGRVSDDQLNRQIQMPVERKRISFKYLWSLLISSFLVSYKTQAQGKIKLDSITTTAPQLIKVPEKLYEQKILIGAISSGNYDDEDDDNLRRKIIRGKVTDEEGNPIPSASINIENSKYGKVADAKGRFKFKIPSDENYSTLIVSSIGYESVYLELEDESQKALNIIMKSSQTELLDEVVVTSLSYSCRRTSGMMMISTVTSENRFRDSLRQIFSKNDVKIYPNPVSAGASFNISFNVAEIGNYELELYDASGRLMHTSSIPILSKKHVMNFGSGLSLTPAIYFVKIISARGKNVYSGSFLVQ